MKKLLTLACLALLLPLAINSQVIKKEDINAQNLYNFRGSMTEYIDPNVKYSKPPKGFKPFYMSHYGRHGSRYLLNTPQYNDPYNILKQADDQGKLTEFGKDVMRRLEIMMKDAEGHLGDLTKVGQQQHRGIARRMVRNYPEIFNSKSTIVARSTTSHRVMASMTSALMEFSTILPKMYIDFNDSDYDRGYMNYEDNAISRAKNSRERSVAVSQFNANHTHPERLMTALFTDTTFITRYVRPSNLTRSGTIDGTQESTVTVINTQDRSANLYNLIYDIAANMGSHDLGFTLDDVFTYEEWYDNWLQNNMYWYSVSGFSPFTQNLVPYGHSTLLQDIVEKADQAISAGFPNANLRYGHDTALFPLLCLMEVNDCAWAPDDLEKVAEKWVDYNIVHMGSNIQLIFFKDKKNTVLVRALLDEKEATLPVDCYKDSKGKEYPYFYEWDKVSKLYREKLDYWAKMKEELTNNR
ncbi:MAG: histidine-type phosphatase [Bacteroidaceae bacterium]|nr:histidine-type phosphatase [Bacteroidaceae bacterium]